MSIHRQQIRSAMTASAVNILTGAEAAALVDGELWPRLFSFTIDGTSMPVLLWEGAAPIVITPSGLTVASLTDGEWVIPPAYRPAAYRSQFDHGDIAEAKVAARDIGWCLAHMATDWKAMGFNLGQDAPPTAGRVFVTPAPAPQQGAGAADADDQWRANRARSLETLDYEARHNDPLRAIAAALVHLARYGVPTWED